MNAQDILTANGLDFNISKRPLFDENQNPSGYFGLYNDSLNKCLHTVKSGYQVSQNKDVVELVLKGIENYATELKVQKAGAIDYGKKIFIQLDVIGDAKVGKDTIKRFITITDSNDGTTGLGVGIGDLTMSCQNQFFKFVRNANKKMRHSASLEKKMEEIPMLLEMALAESHRQIKVYNQLLEVDITKDLADRMVKHLLGIDRVYTSVAELSEVSTRAFNKMNTLYECIESEISDKGLNLWGLHSGVTKFTTHELSSPNRANGKVESQIFGGAYKVNQKSLEYVKRQSGVLELA